MYNNNLITNSLLTPPFTSVGTFSESSTGRAAAIGAFNTPRLSLINTKLAPLGHGSFSLGMRYRSSSPLPDSCSQVNIYGIYDGLINGRIKHRERFYPPVRCCSPSSWNMYMDERDAAGDRRACWNTAASLHGPLRPPIASYMRIGYYNIYIAQRTSIIG